MNDNQKLKILIAIVLAFTVGFIIYLSISYVNCQSKHKENSISGEGNS